MNKIQGHILFTSFWWVITRKMYVYILNNQLLETQLAVNIPTSQQNLKLTFCFTLGQLFFITFVLPSNCQP